MSTAVYLVSYKLKQESLISDFLLAAERLNNEFISKQKGYVSWKQAVDSETWADIITFESMDDLNRFKEISGEVSGNHGELALQFYLFINFNSCNTHLFSVERSYQ